MASFVSYSVIGLLILLCCVGSIRTATILPDTLDVDSDNLFNYTSCEDVRQVFVDTNIGSAKDTTDMSHEEEEIPLCSSSWNSSCCTPTMERRYSAASKKEFQLMLQTSNSFLQSLLSTSATKLRETFLEMIHVSQNNTNVLFSEVYKKMDSVARLPVSQLYSDLSSYISGQPVELESRVAAFFDSLFPLVYHHSINPKLKDFSEDYKECLRETQQEIKPFGDIANRVSLHITRSFSVARTLLEALQVGVEVIKATDNMIFRPECNNGLTKLVYCSKCAGFTGVKACSGYCLNIVRGCLAHVAELDQPWSDYVSGLERMTSGLVASYNIEEVLSVLDTKISEAIMYAMENGPDLSKKLLDFCINLDDMEIIISNKDKEKLLLAGYAYLVHTTGKQSIRWRCTKQKLEKVKTACGHPRRATRDVTDPGPVIPGSAPGRIVPVRSVDESLYTRLQQVVQRLAETKGHYANLADIVCSDETWAVREEGRCWNGASIGQYTKTIAGVGVAAQKYNPEMKAPDTDDTAVMALDEKLQKMGRLLRLSTVPEMPQADSYMIEGSGSGVWPRNPIDDDEDYDRGSGSGDGGGTKKASDFNFDNGDTRDVNIKVKDSSAISISSSSALILSMLLVFFLPRIPGMRSH